MANAQNEHIRNSHRRLYTALENLMKKDITVLSTLCRGSVPIIHVHADHPSDLEMCFVSSHIKDGIRVYEYQTIEDGCLIVWEKKYVH